MAGNCSAELTCDRLKASLAESEGTTDDESNEETAILSDKEQSISYLKNAFEQDNSRMSTF